jgi:hypothetical protein
MRVGAELNDMEESMTNEMTDLDSSAALAAGIAGTVWPHTMDARVWAEKWMEHILANPAIATDEETMVGWFANAIMAGYDAAMMEAQKRANPEANQVPANEDMPPIEYKGHLIHFANSTATCGKVDVTIYASGFVPVCSMVNFISYEGALHAAKEWIDNKKSSTTVVITGP